MASAAEVDPRRRAAIRLELAASYFQAGRIDVALEEVNQALASDPGSADGYGLLALIYMRNQDWDQADASLRKAMSLRPQDGDLQHNYGWLLCQRKQYVQAQEWLDKALAQPGYLERPKTWMAKGLCLQQAGLLVEAQQALLKGYELDAANPVIAYHLSNVMLQGRRQEGAVLYPPPQQQPPVQRGKPVAGHQDREGAAAICSDAAAGRPAAPALPGVPPMAGLRAWSIQ